VMMLLSSASSYALHAMRTAPIGQRAVQPGRSAALLGMGGVSGNARFGASHAPRASTATSHPSTSAHPATSAHPSTQLLNALACAASHALHGPATTFASATTRSLWAPPAVARRSVLTGLLRAEQQLRSFEVAGAAAVAACACATCVAGALCEASCALLFPEAWRRVRMWHGSRRHHAQYELTQAESVLQAALPHVLLGSTLNATVSSRVKSSRSSFAKVALRGKQTLDDLLALRVVLGPAEASGHAGLGPGMVLSPQSRGELEESVCVARCHDVRALIESLWPGGVVQVKDYMGAPKENGYQSLHLLVRLPSGWRCEVQIRTACMHQHAESGGAAHAAYKAASLLQS